MCKFFKLANSVNVHKLIITQIQKFQFSEPFNALCTFQIRIAITEYEYKDFVCSQVFSEGARFNNCSEQDQSRSEIQRTSNHERSGQIICSKMGRMIIHLGIKAQPNFNTSLSFQSHIQLDIIELTPQFSSFQEQTRFQILITMYLNECPLSNSECLNQQQHAGSRSNWNDNWVEQ
ncbi:Hypothetical_protein [Hexamita inflata]|uniref:Hypothetical_protein n=1 Tax=Hexamita inflata TaxID=28002 RepID=A0AA86QJU2_9EUKA|nr:Hypothetical protein HINF_LOCUS47660 [Hexamita inflata]